MVARYAPSDELEGRKKRSSNQELVLDELGPKLGVRYTPKSDSSEDETVELEVSGCVVDNQRRGYWRTSLIVLRNRRLGEVRDVRGSSVYIDHFVNE